MSGVFVQPAMLAVLQQVVETKQAAAQSVAKNAVVIFQTQLKFGRNLVIFSVAPGSRFNGANRIAHHAAVAMHRTRRPIALAHLIEHGAADTNTCECFETRAFAGVVFA